MNELKIFENSDFGQVRTLEHNNDVYFVAKDVADILGYQNGSRDINLHVEEEDRLKTLYELYAEQNGLKNQIKSIKETCSLDEQKRNTSTLYQKNVDV